MHADLVREVVWMQIQADYVKITLALISFSLYGLEPA
jgi:hypothetical protein